MSSGGPTSQAECVEWLVKHFDAESGRDLRAGFQFLLEDAGAVYAPIYAQVDDGRLEAGLGTLPTPDVRFRLPADDFYAVLAGRENAEMLFMAGRLEIEGDLSLALKVRTLFRGS